MNNRNRRHGSHASTGRDPVVIAIRAACVILACGISFLIVTGCQHAQAKAAHPCPPGRTAMLAPTGWGCGMSQTIGVKSR